MTTKLILEKLDNIKSELDYIKEHWSEPQKNGTRYSAIVG